MNVWTIGITTISYFSNNLSLSYDISFFYLKAILQYMSN